MEVPTVDPGNLILFKESCKASFKVEKVNALNDDSDNVSEFTRGEFRLQ